MTKKMVYVAADPEQPGAAWAIMVDDLEFSKNPQNRKHMADTLSDWVKRGGIVQHVTLEEGKEMLRKWQRPFTQLNLFK